MQHNTPSVKTFRFRKANLFKRHTHIIAMYDKLPISPCKSTVKRVQCSLELQLGTAAIKIPEVASSYIAIQLCGKCSCWSISLCLFNLNVAWLPVSVIPHSNGIAFTVV
jgi:hypothetical protein